MARSDEGFKSDALKIALEEALAGKRTRIEELLARHGGLPGPRPNVKLAQAFGVELAEASGMVLPLLKKLAAEDAAPDTPLAFLPTAAAHGYVARLRAGHDQEAAWPALLELAADERGVVRLGVVDAMLLLACRAEHAAELLVRAQDYLETEDRELCFGAAAMVVETLGDGRVLACLRDTEALLSYVSAVIDKIADAPRAAERSEGRRRALTSLTRTVPILVGALRANDRGTQWLEAECVRAKHPDVRKVLSESIVRLSGQGQTLGTSVADALRKHLEGSAKPLRDPTLRRQGTGRGARTRRTR